MEYLKTQKAESARDTQNIPGEVLAVIFNG